MKISVNLIESAISMSQLALGQAWDKRGTRWDKYPHTAVARNLVHYAIGYRILCICIILVLERRSLRQKKLLRQMEHLSAAWLQ